jgi:hypothetical protein
MSGEAEDTFPPVELPSEREIALTELSLSRLPADADVWIVPILV